MENNMGNDPSMEQLVKDSNREALVAPLINSPATMFSSEPNGFTDNSDAATNEVPPEKMIENSLALDRTIASLQKLSADCKPSFGAKTTKEWVFPEDEGKLMALISGETSFSFRISETNSASNLNLFSIVAPKNTVTSSVDELSACAAINSSYVCYATRTIICVCPTSNANGENFSITTDRRTVSLCLNQERDNFLLVCDEIGTVSLYKLGSAHWDVFFVLEFANSPPYRVLWYPLEQGIFFTFHKDKLIAWNTAGLKVTFDTEGSSAPRVRKANAELVASFGCLLPFQCDGSPKQVSERLLVDVCFIPALHYIILAFNHSTLLVWTVKLESSSLLVSSLHSEITLQDQYGYIDISSIYSYAPQFFSSGGAPLNRSSSHFSSTLSQYFLVGTKRNSVLKVFQLNDVKRCFSTPTVLNCIQQLELFPSPTEDTPMMLSLLPCLEILPSIMVDETHAMVFWLSTWRSGKEIFEIPFLHVLQFESMEGTEGRFFSSLSVFPPSEKKSLNGFVNIRTLRLPAEGLYFFPSGLSSSSESFFFASISSIMMEGRHERKFILRWNYSPHTDTLNFSPVLTILDCEEEGSKKDMLNKVTPLEAVTENGRDEGSMPFVSVGREENGAQKSGDGSPLWDTTQGEARQNSPKKVKRREEETYVDVRSPHFERIPYNKGGKSTTFPTKETKKGNFTGNTSSQTSSFQRVTAILSRSSSNEGTVSASNLPFRLVEPRWLLRVSPADEKVDKGMSSFADFNLKSGDMISKPLASSSGWTVSSVSENVFNSVPETLPISSKDSHFSKSPVISPFNTEEKFSSKPSSQQVSEQQTESTPVPFLDLSLVGGTVSTVVESVGNLGKESRKKNEKVKEKGIDKTKEKQNEKIKEKLQEKLGGKQDKQSVEKLTFEGGDACRSVQPSSMPTTKSPLASSVRSPTVGDEGNEHLIDKKGTSTVFNTAKITAISKTSPPTQKTILSKRTVAAGSSGDQNATLRSATSSSVKKVSMLPSKKDIVVTAKTTMSTSTGEMFKSGATTVSTPETITGKKGSPLLTMAHESEVLDASLHGGEGDTFTVKEKCPPHTSIVSTPPSTARLIQNEKATDFLTSFSEGEGVLEGVKDISAFEKNLLAVSPKTFSVVKLNGLPKEAGKTRKQRSKAGATEANEGDGVAEEFFLPLDQTENMMETFAKTIAKEIKVLMTRLQTNLSQSVANEYKKSTEGFKTLFEQKNENQAEELIQLASLSEDLQFLKTEMKKLATNATKKATVQASKEVQALLLEMQTYLTKEIEDMGSKIIKSKQAQDPDAIQAALRDVISKVIVTEIKSQFMGSVVPALRETLYVGINTIKESVVIPQNVHAEALQHIGSVQNEILNEVKEGRLLKTDVDSLGTSITNISTNLTANISNLDLQVKSLAERLEQIEKLLDSMAVTPGGVRSRKLSEVGETTTMNLHDSDQQLIDELLEKQDYINAFHCALSLEWRHDSVGQYLLNLCAKVPSHCLVEKSDVIDPLLPIALSRNLVTALLNWNHKYSFKELQKYLKWVRTSLTLIPWYQHEIQNDVVMEALQIMLNELSEMSQQVLSRGTKSVKDRLLIEEIDDIKLQLTMVSKHVSTAFSSAKPLEKSAI